MTNSYNRTKALGFDIGFWRAICTNGLIFRQKHIVFRYYHTHEEMVDEERLVVDASPLRELGTAFIGQMRDLKEFTVPRKHMLALACKVFGIRVRKKDLSKPRRRRQLEHFTEEIDRLTAKYFDDLGENGYAALNVLTDFAARPRSYISQQAMIDPLQKRCGDWTVSFLEAIKESSFNYDSYLGSFAKDARLLRESEGGTE